jgi:hypothetical protein
MLQPAWPVRAASAAAQEEESDAENLFALDYWRRLAFL